MNLIEKFAVCTLFFVYASVGLIYSEQLFMCSFAKGGWNETEWILVKSPHWSNLGKWIQQDAYIENETSKEAIPAEPLENRSEETYTGMVLKNKFSQNITIRSTVEFTDQLSSLIIIAPELGESADKIPEYREYFEIFVYNKGVNILHHFYENGKPSCKKSPYPNFELKPNIKYQLLTGISTTNNGRMLSVIIDTHEINYFNNSLPNDFYVGIAGCEGINHFYYFSVEK